MEKRTLKFGYQFDDIGNWLTASLSGGVGILLLLALMLLPLELSEEIRLVNTPATGPPVVMQ